MTEDKNFELRKENFMLKQKNQILEQENNKLLDVINNQDVKITDLEKENMSLIETLDKLGSDFRICESNADTYYDQLTKAKELIEKVAGMYRYSPRVEEIIEQAEQFLKESQNENSAACR